MPARNHRSATRKATTQCHELIHFGLKKFQTALADPLPTTWASETSSAWAISIKVGKVSSKALAFLSPKPGTTWRVLIKSRSATQTLVGLGRPYLNGLTFFLLGSVCKNSKTLFQRRCTMNYFASFLSMKKYPCAGKCQNSPIVNYNYRYELRHQLRNLIEVADWNDGQAELDDTKVLHESEIRRWQIAAGANDQGRWGLVRLVELGQFLLEHLRPTDVVCLGDDQDKAAAAGKFQIGLG